MFTDRRWLVSDHQGTIIAHTDSSGATQRYAYGPYGEPAAWTGPRFRYTGQIALPEAQLYHYKARVYDPVLGRFLQTDPIGYEDDFNLYAYVRNDPLNGNDPLGLEVLVLLEGYELKGSAGHGHASVRAIDLEGDGEFGFRAGPNPPYEGGMFSGSPTNLQTGVLLNLGNDRSLLDSVAGPEVPAIEAGHAQENQSPVVNLGSVIVDMDFSEAASRLESLSTAIDAAQIEYKPRSDNSNAVAGTGFRELTGQKPNNREGGISFPGIRRDLRSRIQ